MNLHFEMPKSIEKLCINGIVLINKNKEQQTKEEINNRKDEKNARWS